MRRESKNMITYSLTSKEIQKALVQYVNDNKTDCGKLGFASDEAKIVMALNKNMNPVNADITDIYKNDEEESC